MAVDHNEFVSVAEAAKLLRVSLSTIKRWLKAGRLPAYHLGPRYVRIRRTDLDRLLTPLGEEVSPMQERPSGESSVIPSALTVQPLTEAQLAQLDEAIRRSQQGIEAMRKRRNGEPLAPSWPILREIREERAKRDA